MQKKLLVESDPYETRVAILEQDRLTELFIERHGQLGVTDDIYNQDGQLVWVYDEIPPVISTRTDTATLSDRTQAVQHGAGFGHVARVQKEYVGIGQRLIDRMREALGRHLGQCGAHPERERLRAKRVRVKRVV